MTTVRELLKIKGGQVWSIPPQTTVLDALKLMAEKNVGALIVVHEGKLAGVISERDFARAIANQGRCMIDTPVQDYMTRTVFTVSPEMTTDDCMSIMTDKKIRHLPVVGDDKLVGMISIGDVVKEIITSRESHIHILENYIEGTDYGR
jgi:CBS domain-containing protein